MAARRAAGQEPRRLAEAMRAVGTAAEARRRNASEGSAARIHSGQLLIAGGMESSTTLVRGAICGPAQVERPYRISSPKCLIGRQGYRAIASVHGCHPALMYMVVC